MFIIFGEFLEISSPQRLPLYKSCNLYDLRLKTLHKNDKLLKQYLHFGSATVKWEELC